MKNFDCQLDHFPEIRLQAESPEAAKAEYFRLYALIRSTADWHCREVKDGDATPAPVEPETWVTRRKQLGTWEGAAAASSTKADEEPARASQDSAASADAGELSTSTKADDPAAAK